MRRWLALSTVALCCVCASSRAGFYLGASWLSTDAELETAVGRFETDDSA